MKKLSGILLLACLSLPALGTYTWLQYKKLMVKQEVKQAMKAGMSKERLVRLAFAQDQMDTLLRWEHAREFEFQDQMYDVLEQKIQGDSIVYWCWWDQEETFLNRYLDDLTKKAFAGDPQQQKAQDQLLQFYKSIYCSIPDALSPLPLVVSAESSQSLIWGEKNEHYSWKQGPSSPPPQLV
ncbi:MAG: hypothetical protein SFV55_03610 [Haliscomenobacter sp.]|uniref:hypothetical protein n=1 Tax=Haliscomenobacter sp. TaxID=2717303 RepID=UPI0029A5B8AE|nr:hypothetical protein [Haliscomenobacter sp.]MDX2067486.1 hypothetical protein [Haliscomenobacter sp.]